MNPAFGVAHRLRARGVDGAARLCEQALEDTGAAFLPGSSFGRPDSELTARIALVDFDGARALAALDGLDEKEPLDEAWLETHCPCVTGAIERLAGWAKAR